MRTAGEPLVSGDATPSGRRRVVVVVVLVVLLGAAGFGDRAGRPPKPTAHRLSAGMPIAPPGAALSSSWFCPGGTAGAGGTADVSVAAVNTTTTRAEGTLTVVPSEGDPKQVPLVVEARSRTVTRLGDVVAASYDAALVDLDQGGVAVVVTQ